MSYPPISDEPIDGPSWLFITDTHVGQSVNLGNMRTVVDLARAEGAIEGVIHGGDGNETPLVSFLDWWRDPEGGGAPASEKLIMAAGNHDTATVPGSGATEDPFSAWRSRQWWCGSREWGRVSVGPVSFYVLNDLTDALDAGTSCYDNCNPPGEHNELNPDWSGITDPESEQRLWLAAELAADTTPWKVGVMHRPAWGPFSAARRPIHTAIQGLIQSCCFSLALSGDLHGGALCGPFSGCWSLTQAGGYYIRPVDLDAFPGLPVVWSSSTAQNNSGLAHCARISFGEETASIRIFEASNANLTGGLVFAQTIERVNS